MADPRKKKKSGGPRTARLRAAKPAPMAERVGDLAWAGQHTQAIELATAALATTALSVAGRLDLLDLRAESFIAQGHLARASADAAEMLDLANRAKAAGPKAQARNRLALVQMRGGDLKGAVATANAALKASRQSKQVGLEAHTKVAQRAILIDQATRSALSERITAEPLGLVPFKGKAAAVDVFSVDSGPKR